MRPESCLCVAAGSVNSGLHCEVCHTRTHTQTHTQVYCTSWEFGCGVWHKYEAEKPLRDCLGNKKKYIFYSKVNGRFTAIKCLCLPSCLPYLPFGCQPLSYFSPQVLLCIFGSVQLELEEHDIIWSSLPRRLATIGKDLSRSQCTNEPVIIQPFRRNVETRKG